MNDLEIVDAEGEAPATDDCAVESQDEEEGTRGAGCVGCGDGAAQAGIWARRGAVGYVV